MKNKQKHTQTNTKTLQRRQIPTVEFKPQIIKHEDENTSNVAAVTKLMELTRTDAARVSEDRPTEEQTGLHVPPEPVGLFRSDTAGEWIH